MKERIAKVLRRFRPKHLRNYRRGQGQQGQNMQGLQPRPQQGQGHAFGQNPQQHLDFVKQRMAEWQAAHPGQAVPSGFQHIVDRLTARMNGTPMSAPVGAAVPTAPQGQLDNGRSGYPQGQPFTNGVFTHPQQADFVHPVFNGQQQSSTNMAAPVARPQLPQQARLPGGGPPALEELEENPNRPAGYGGASLAPFRNRVKA
ncbi:hypothetical protein [Caudoviricetes sp.]|nr:hypothetical protein [Caudoviricetes sp.]UOF79143.1 hypothetical protein [Caudoviricetes sp.]